jgi:hypothetical protein
MKLQPSTYFAILAEFGTAHIPVVDVGRKYFNLEEKKAKIKAARSEYPFPVFRAAGQKSEWLVDASDLAKYIDAIKEKASKQFDAAH